VKRIISLPKNLVIGAVSRVPPIVLRLYDRARWPIHHHTLFQPAGAYEIVRDFARASGSPEVLDVGAGGRSHDTTARALFPNARRVWTTDVDPASIRAYGSRLPGAIDEVVDATEMTYDASFDVVLCFGVLPFIRDYQRAVDRMAAALREDGTLILACQWGYPIRYEPHDYFRFSPHALAHVTKALPRFRCFRYGGLRDMPYMFIAFAGGSRGVLSHWQPSEQTRLAFSEEPEVARH
jgi:SAM-dependent methyltransferase